MPHSITSHNPRLTVRPSTAEDVTLLTSFEKPPMSIRALTFLLDGEVSGIGGVQFSPDGYVVFSNIKPDITVSPASIVRCGHAVMGMVKSMGVRAFAVREHTLPRAHRFLQCMGFELFEKDGDMEVWKWHN